MKRISFAIICMVASIYCASAQYWTHNVNSSGENKYVRWKVDAVYIEEAKTIVYFEFTALRSLSGLYVYNGVADFNGGNPITRDFTTMKFAGSNTPFTLQGSLEQGGSVHRIELHESWGWHSVSKGETVKMALCFYPIPASVTSAKIFDFTLCCNRNYTTWDISLNGLNNPRRNYTPFNSETSVKQYLDVNNDGICGIYEEVGGNNNVKHAVVKHNGKYTLIYISDNSSIPGWKTGDIQAILQPTTNSGMFKANWYTELKYMLQNVYIAFDGTSMKASFHVGTSNAYDSKYVKMYPTEAPAYEKINEAVEELKNENYQSVIKMLSNIIASKATDNEHRYYAYMLRAYAYRAMELYKSAIADYTSALNCKPGDEDAYYERGLLKLHLEDITGIDDLKRSGEFGRALLIEYDLLDYDTSKPIQKEQAPPLKKQSIPQLKKTNR